MIRVDFVKFIFEISNVPAVIFFNGFFQQFQILPGKFENVVVYVGKRSGRALKALRPVDRNQQSRNPIDAERGADLMYYNSIRSIILLS